MKKIRVIFYKAKWWDGHWLDNAINCWTWLISAKNRKVGPYSHVEIWTADEDGRFLLCETSDGSISSIEATGNTSTHAINMPWTKLSFLGTCWTSTMRGKDKGTVKRDASSVIKDASRWDYCEIELDIFEYEFLLLSMENDVKRNKGYSVRDIFRFFFPFHRNDESKYICSEFVNNKLFVIECIKELDIPSPRRLAWKLVHAGYEIKQL